MYLQKTDASAAESTAALAENGSGTNQPAHNYQLSTTGNNGYLGSRNDEERSEMRYVMRIAEFSESSNL
jgi:hypothetical protein